MQRRPTHERAEQAGAPSADRVISSPGQPSNSPTRAFIEPHLGHDFSRVRVHADDDREAESASVVKARAYTVGEHIVFGATQAQPKLGSGLMLQRACACATHTAGVGECSTCRQRRQAGAITPARSAGARVDRSLAGVVDRRPAGQDAVPQGTNYAFDTYRITEAHLADPDIVARLNALSEDQLTAYRDKVADPAVKSYIQSLIVSRMKVPIPCSKTDIENTEKAAEAGRLDGVSRIAVARQGLDRLHGAWINNKAEVLAGTTTLSGDPVCAFDSNFNITQRDPQYGVQQIRLMQRLRHLEGRLGKAVPYECQAENDPLCKSNADGQTEAFVVNQQPPIHFCEPFRSNIIVNGQTATVVHEFAHLVPGVHDQGGYAAWGSIAMTCKPNVQFKASTDVLMSTADALTGFVMYLGETGNIAVRAR